MTPTPTPTHGAREGTLEAGDNGSLIGNLHGDMCGNGARTFTKMGPVTFGSNHPDLFGVVFMEWCGDCGAAAWEVVG